MNLELREISVEAEGDSETISEKQLAYSLVSNGFTHADTLAKQTASPFIIAFAFENGERFYFTSDNIVHVQFGKARPVMLMGRANGIAPKRLSDDYDFLLEATRWNGIALITTEEQIIFKREPLVHRLMRRLGPSRRD